MGTLVESLPSAGAYEAMFLFLLILRGSTKKRLSLNVVKLMNMDLTQTQFSTEIPRHLPINEGLDVQYPAKKSERNFFKHLVRE